MKEADLVLKLRGVSKKFGKQQVLKNVSLDVKRGEIFGLIGSSGSGKTTLLNIISGNMLPDSGTILFEPKAFTKYDPKEPYLEPLQLNPELTKKTMGYSPQTPSIYDKLTCKENLDLFASLYGIQKDIKKVNIKILLGLVDLKDFEKRKAEDLSGGMKKRLDLACSLVHDPKIISLDEPTSDLDVILRKQMWELIRKINGKGTTIIMSSHFIDEIEGLCDRIGILHNGTLAFIGSPRELKARSNGGITIKIETAARNYAKITDKIKECYKGIEVRATEVLEIYISNVKDPVVEAQRILNLVNTLDSQVVDFSYAKEGVAEVFREITSHKGTAIEHTQKDEVHRLKAKLKEERKKETKKHTWKI